MNCFLFQWHPDGEGSRGDGSCGPLINKMWQSSVLPKFVFSETLLNESLLSAYQKKWYKLTTYSHYFLAFDEVSTFFESSKSSMICYHVIKVYLAQVSSCITYCISSIYNHYYQTLHTTTDKYTELSSPHCYISWSNIHSASSSWPRLQVNHFKSRETVA